MQSSSHRGFAESGLENKVVHTIYEVLSRAVRVQRENPGVQFPESEVLLHVWNCGGQPVFLEVLPLFLTSRTMFVIMFDASKYLHDK